MHVSISAFTGRVYNVTPFLKYHPGGKAQLMKGAGIDCTALFDKVHVYPNHCEIQNTLSQFTSCDHIDFCIVLADSYVGK